ncbi:hypothetical protein RhoFasGS6_03743 [Rhodococcus fascians]|nr:hypothetical protein [Rhodococcus fascians]
MSGLGGPSRITATGVDDVGRACTMEFSRSKPKGTDEPGRRGRARETQWSHSCGGERLQGNPLRGTALRCTPLSGTTATRVVGGRPAGHRIRPDGSQARISQPDRPDSVRGGDRRRRLPEFECLDARRRGCGLAGTGMDSRWFVHQRQRRGTHVRRHRVRPRRNRVRHHQLPIGRRRIPGDRRSARQPRSAGSGCGARMGGRQHYGVRRRPRSGDDCGGVGGRDECGHAAVDATREGAVLPRHPAERRRAPCADGGDREKGDRGVGVGPRCGTHRRRFRFSAGGGLDGRADRAVESYCQATRSATVGRAGPQRHGVRAAHRRGRGAGPADRCDRRRLHHRRRDHGRIQLRRTCAVLRTQRGVPAHRRESAANGHGGHGLRRGPGARALPRRHTRRHRR